MSKKPDSLGKGDWIVHSYYGIGQIKNIETKEIDEIETRYFKVRTKNSTYFVPINKIDNDRIRPLSSEYLLRKAKKILQSPPEELPENHNDRKKFISETCNDSSMVTSAVLLRDLYNRKMVDGLNDFEMRTLHSLERLFIREWSIIKEIPEEEAQKSLEKIVTEKIPSNS